MKKKLTFLMVICILLLGMTGCIVRDQSSAHKTINEGSKFTDTYKYTVKDDFKGMKLKINLTLNKGQVSFKLKDPNGNVKWEGKVTSDKPMNETKEFDKIVGEWNLTFENVNNSGDGKLELQFNRL
ncbi:hypothetical protein NRP93_003313 [Clostridium botulinum]|nr:hypothetical protein [Clostridium botulinum]